MPTKRRGHGEGTIVQRKDGRWVAAITVPGAKRKFIYGKSRREVADRMNGALRDLQHGVAPSPDNITVSRFMTDWLKAVKSSVRPRTHSWYAMYLQRHVEPSLGRLRLNRVTARHLEQLYAIKLTEGLAPQSVRHIHTCIHRMLQSALEWQLVARNVADLAKPVRVPKQEMEIFSPTEVRTLLDAVRASRHEALYTLALVTGMRQAELLGLRWNDIDLDRGNVHVRYTIQTVNGGWEFVEPKTERSRRTVPIGATTIATLKKHRAAQSEGRLRIGAAWNDFDLVFTTKVGTPLTGQNLLRRFHYPMLQAAGLPKRNFHALRHTFASMALAQGRPITQVSQALGHSNVNTTLTTYSHALPTTERQIADAMESVVGVS